MLLFADFQCGTELIISDPLNPESCSRSLSFSDLKLLSSLCCFGPMVCGTASPLISGVSTQMKLVPPQRPFLFYGIWTHIIYLYVCSVSVTRYPCLKICTALW